MKYNEQARRPRRHAEELNGKGGDHSTNRKDRDPLFTVRMNKEFFDSVNGWLNTKSEVDGATKKEIIFELFTNAIQDDLQSKQKTKSTVELTHS